MYRVWVESFVKVLSGFCFLLFLSDFGGAGAGAWAAWPGQLGWAGLGWAGLDWAGGWAGLVLTDSFVFLVWLGFLAWPVGGRLVLLLAGAALSWAGAGLLLGGLVLAGLGWA